MILVTGATGNVGAELVTVLREAGEPVRALVRSPDAAVPAGVERAIGDLNEPASLTAAFGGVEGMFLLSGYRELPATLAAARRAGVRRVALLSGGAAVASDVGNPISQYMLNSEQAARDSGMDWTILRPYEFMSNALRWAPQLAAGDVVRAPFAGVPVAVIDPYDIAAVAAAALLDTGHAGQAYRLSGPQALLPAERVEILAAELRRPLRLAAQPDDQARTEMLASMPSGYVDAFFAFYAGGTLDESQPLPTVADITRRPPRTFGQWAHTHAGQFC